MTKPRLRDRSTGDLLVLMIAGTVCGIIVLSTVSIIAGAAFAPEHGVSDAAGAVGDIVNTMIGLLAGFLAGRSATTLTKVPGEGKREPPT